MSLNIETDLVKILEKIDTKIDKLSNDVVDLKIAVVKSEEKLSGEIRTLDEKVNGLAKRVDDQAFINRGVLIGLIVAICGGAAKLFGFLGNP
jgi:hypothetical protein